MLGRAFTQSARRISMGQFGAKRNMSFFNNLYNGIWKKSTTSYIAYVVAGCIVVDFVYGTYTDFVWDAINHGVRKLIIFRNFNTFTNTHSL